MGKKISCKWKRQKAGVAVLICNKIDFKTQAIVRNKEGHYINDKGNNPTRGHNPSKHLHTQHRDT